MLGSLIAAAAFQVGPFYEQRPAEDYYALRPLVAREGEDLDVLWPVFTRHRDWWSFCLLVNWQSHPEEGDYQFSVVPFWFNGHDRESGSYMGLFPIAGRHPHVGTMYDLRFALWPLWTSYKMPRPSTGETLETNAVLFPFFSWRSDGAWSFWPLYGVNYQRESEHRYALWPLVTWADYRDDRDTAGEGYSWMAVPLYGRVRRRHESQDLFLPPFFSYGRSWSKVRGEGAADASAAPDSVRVRCPWPLVEYERTPARRRLSIWPLYERVVDLDYLRGEETAHVTRFGWKLVEIYDDETRVFPFYASGRGHFRLWPFWESETGKDERTTRFLSLFPIRWVPQVDRNWAKFWTLYEGREYADRTEHSLLWGIIRWRTAK